MIIKNNFKSITKRDDTTIKTLTDNVRSTMEYYFKYLGGNETGNLYSSFLEQVEKPFFNVVMEYKKGNINHASQVLGLNRATLMKKLRKYGIEY